MNPYITIPREALVALLRSAGSPLTPEEYVASLPLPDAVLYRKYANRAWAAAVSKYFLLVVAVLAVISLPFMGFTIENIVITAGLVTVTATFASTIPRRPASAFAIKPALPRPSSSTVCITRWSPPRFSCRASTAR